MSVKVKATFSRSLDLNKKVGRAHEKKGLPQEDIPNVWCHHHKSTVSHNLPTELQFLDDIKLGLWI